LLLSDASAFACKGAGPDQSVRLELLAQLHALDDVRQHSHAPLSYHPGSVVHLMAVTLETENDDRGAASQDADRRTARRVLPEILPLANSPFGAREPATVWTPRAAAKQVDLEGTADEIDLVLQVLEPTAAADANAEPNEPPLFWSWKLRASHSRFSVRLQPTSTPTVQEVELQGARFVDPRPVRSLDFPRLPHIRLHYEPIELALLIDGYWLANDGIADLSNRSSLHLLIDLLDSIDEREGLTKRGMLIHAAICLDQHVSPEFLAAYGAPPVLQTLADSPMETTAQFIAEWLQPWMERWKQWEIKPYPVDTDVALERGFRYLRNIKWQLTTQPEQRAVLLFGRSRPHEHARYFLACRNQAPLYPKVLLDRLEIPYHPEDRFSVTDVDWREELRRLRESTATILALCDPGLPNPYYRLSQDHVLWHEYQAFWATVDSGTRLDTGDEPDGQSAALGISRVVETLDAQLFERRALRRFSPPLSYPVAQILPMQQV
jgi:hypothetical protein